jgi:hypothetical protein
MTEYFIKWYNKRNSSCLSWNTFSIRVTLHSIQYRCTRGDSDCGHQVVWYRLTGAFVAYNRRYLKSWVGNSSEGPFWTKWGQTKYCRDFSRLGPTTVPHVSISPFHVSSSVSICVAIRCNRVQYAAVYGQDLGRSPTLNLAWTLGRRRRRRRHRQIALLKARVPAPDGPRW